jgi:hypothetical protein
LGLQYRIDCILLTLPSGVFRGSKNGQKSVPDSGMVSAPAIGAGILFTGTPKYNESGRLSESILQKAQFPIFFMTPLDPVP